MDSITTFAGNLTEDPKMSFTRNKGVAVAEFTVAVNRRVKNAEDQWEDAPATFKPVRVVGRSAENIADSVIKGTRVMVTAAEETRSYLNKDGENRTFTYNLVSDYFGEVGVSLKRATAKVTRVTRSNADEGQQAGDVDPWATQEPGQD